MRSPKPTKRNGRKSRLLTQLLMSAAATLVVVAAVPAVQAYLTAARPPARDAAPRFEQRIPNGLRVIAVHEGSADTLERVELEKGKAVVLAADFTIERVAVGDPTRAGVVVIDARTVQVVPKETGDTNVLLWDDQGRLATAVDIHVGVGQAQMLTEIRRALGNRDISVDMAGDSVVLRGMVYQIGERERAEQIATAFFKGGLKPGEREPHVINLIDVAGNHQVQLNVTIAEMSRNAEKELEVDWQAIIHDGATAAAFGSTMGGAALASGVFSQLSSPGGGLFSGVLGPSAQVTAYIKLAKKKGLAKILAEPTLVARSGQKANFLAGGEVPLLEPSGLGTVAVKLKPFGVGIDFLPTVLGPDRIHLEVTPEAFARIAVPDAHALARGGRIEVESARRAEPRHNRIDIRHVHPVGTAIEGNSKEAGVSNAAPADPRRRLDHGIASAERREPTRRRDAGRPGPDDDHIDRMRRTLQRRG